MKLNEINIKRIYFFIILIEKNHKLNNLLTITLNIFFFFFCELNFIYEKIFIIFIYLTT